MFKRPSSFSDDGGRVWFVAAAVLVESGSSWLGKDRKGQRSGRKPTHQSCYFVWDFAGRLVARAVIWPSGPLWKPSDGFHKRRCVTGDRIILWHGKSRLTCEWFEGREKAAKFK